MHNNLALPDAMSLLEQRLRTQSTALDLLQVLRILQQLGMSQSDMRVHVERSRAANDANQEDETIEETALLALDMIHGDVPGLSLKWDPAELARIYLPKCLDRTTLQRASKWAFVPNDLLPARPGDRLPAEGLKRAVNLAISRLDNFEAIPQPADLYRVPKSSLLTRPAALLAPLDRLLYEALGEFVADRLDQVLPKNVVWPRSRESAPNYASFDAAPLTWGSKYIVIADIEGFYECIDHSILSAVVGARLRLNVEYLHALENFLTAVMGSKGGLPQGPPASDLFASAYLLLVDDSLYQMGWPFSRYADDLRIGCDSVLDARRKIEWLESRLSGIGLRLKPQKTTVLKLETYRRGIQSGSQMLGEFRQEMAKASIERLEESGDFEAIREVMRHAGVDNETLFAVFYHGTMSVEEVVNDFQATNLPDLVESYKVYFELEATKLTHAPPSDPSIERQLAECLISLAAAQEPVEHEKIKQVMLWFPGLAEHVSAYLTSVSKIQPRLAQIVVGSWLCPLADTDWVTAWMCRVLENEPALIDNELESTLTQLVHDQNVGLLTRVGAAWALGRKGVMDGKAWHQLWHSSTPAIRAEIAFAAASRVRPGIPPNLDRVEHESE